MSGQCDLRLYAVLDPERCRGRSLPELAAAAARGGATLIQLRDKHGGTRRQVEHARAVLQALAPFDVSLVINDRVDVVMAAEAHGVHLGQADLHPADARALIGAGAIIGATVHHPAEARAVDPSLVDYAGIGPVFATASKDSEDPPIGPYGLARLI
ncbi:MAG: thiamine phosphate synthase, partial [Geminicoccaceae bacterium]